VFPNNISPFGGLVKVILALVLIGLIMGLVLTGSDLTNFITNSAKAEAMKSQNEFEEKKNAIDLEKYESTQKAEAQAEEERILAETDALERSLELDLLLKERKVALDLEVATFSKYLWSGMIPLLVFCFVIGIVIFMVQAGRSRLILAQAQVKQIDPWQDLAWRKERIQIARQQEQLTRQTLAHIANTFSPEEAPIPWDIHKEKHVKSENV
jgi:Na+/glutamate symporter